eukprot:m.28514 g.28514  ORF g.28514 m.28514 type:complete len:171 (+) comp9482_c0_seq2:101-613(+)
MESHEIPFATVERVTKLFAPKGRKVTKELSHSISDCLHAFIRVITEQMKEICAESNRKMMQPTDVIEALEKLNLPEEYVNVANECLETVTANVKRKKDRKKAAKEQKEKLNSEEMRQKQQRLFEEAKRESDQPVHPSFQIKEDIADGTESTNEKEEEEESEDEFALDDDE